jgi:hypothetical protein
MKDMIMNSQTLTAINVLTTRRNIAMRKLTLIAGIGAAEVEQQLQIFITGAEARARALGARLVAMPGRPGAVIADVFLSMIADD